MSLYLLVTFSGIVCSLHVSNMGSLGFISCEKSCLHQAFADAYSILEKELFETSTVDGNKGGDSFNLLQKIIPSIAGNWCLG